jgi:hypothetical protein
VLHASGFHGQDTDVLKLDTVTQVYVVLGHSWFVQMTEPDVLVVLLDPGLNGMPRMSNEDLTTFTKDAVNATF